MFPTNSLSHQTTSNIKVMSPRLCRNPLRWNYYSHLCPTTSVRSFSRGHPKRIMGIHETIQRLAKWLWTSTAQGPGSFHPTFDSWFFLHPTFIQLSSNKHHAAVFFSVPTRCLAKIGASAQWLRWEHGKESEETGLKLFWKIAASKNWDADPII